MNTYNKIIFVCQNDTGRGPMGATIMEKYLFDKDIIVESRGMIVLFQEPYNPKAVAVASAHGMIMVNKTSIQLVNEDFDTGALVLVMDEPMKQKIYETYDRAINVYTLAEFVGDNETVLIDPYGKDIEEYNKCFEQMQGLIKKAAEIIIGNMEE